MMQTAYRSCAELDQSWGYFALHYSKTQHDLILSQDESFLCNTYKGAPYSELRTGFRQEDCESNFKDAICIISGSNDVLTEAEKHIVYF